MFEAELRFNNRRTSSFRREPCLPAGRLDGRKNKKLKVLNFLQATPI